MTKLKEAWIILIYLTTAFKGLLSYHCTDDNIQKCMQPTKDYMRKMEQRYPQHQATELALFHLSEQEIREYCRIYDTKTSDCLAELIGHCTYLDKKTFQGMEDSSDYMCKEKLETYIRHKSCIGSDVVQDKILQCVTELDFKINLLDLTQPFSQLAPKFCSIIYGAIDCDANAASKCGSEAQEFIRTYETKTFDPLMEEYECDNEGLQITTILPTVAAVVIILAIVSICAVWYCHQKKKASRSQQHCPEPVVFSNVLSGGLSSLASPPATSITDEKSGLPPDYTSHPQGGVEPPPSYRSNDAMSHYEDASVHNQPSSGNPPQYTTLQNNGTAQPQTVNSPGSVAGSNIQESSPVYVDPENKHSGIRSPETAGNRESSPDYSYAYVQPR